MGMRAFRAGIRRLPAAHAREIGRRERGPVLCGSVIPKEFREA